MRTIKKIFLAALLLSFAVVPYAQHTDILNTNQNTYIETFGGGNGKNAFLQFDISSIPANAVITDVRFLGYVFYQQAAWDGDVRYIRFNDQTWLETDSTQITWNAALFTDTVIQFAGFGMINGYSQSPDLTQLFVADFMPSNTFFSIVMKDVDDGTCCPSWVPSFTNTDSLLMGNPFMIPDNKMAFRPRLYANPNERPYLVVSYGIPPSAMASAGGAYCVGANTLLVPGITGDGPFTYQWLHDGVSMPGETNDTLSLTSLALSDSGAYKIIVTNVYGVDTSNQTWVTVNSLPLATASNTGPYCAGETIQLNSSGGIGYSWSGPLAYNNGTQNPTIASSTVAMSGDYTVTVTNAAGCTSTSSTTVTVNTLPTATASNTGPYCIGETIQLNSNGGGTYSWSGPLAYSDGSQNPFFGPATIGMSGAYTVTVTSAAGCTSTSTTTVIVNALPTPTSSNTGPYCEGETIQLNSTGGGTYLWNGPLAYSNGTQNPTILSATTAMSGDYTVTVTNGVGCTSTSATTVIVNTLPTPTSSNTGPYCVGETIQLNSNGGGTYSWSGPLAYSNGTQNPTIASGTTAMSGDYTVTVTNAAGCSSTSATTVTVNALPTPTASNTGPYCVGTTIQLNSTGGGTYLWAGPLAYSDPTQNPTIASATIPMSGDYTVTVTNAAGCTSSSTTTVLVTNTPIATATNIGPFCEGETIQLNSTGGGTYAWSGPLSYSDGTQNPSIASATIGMAGTYTVTVTLVGGCTASSTTAVVVNTNPIATASNTGPYCVGETIQLNSSGGSPYSWSGPLSFTSGVQNPMIINSTTGMSGAYIVTATNGVGCTATASTNVTVNALPSPIANNTGPYCIGTMIQLNSPTGSATDDWTGPLGYIQNNMQNPTFVSDTVAMTGIYTVTVTDANGCSATATTTVTVSDCSGIEEEEMIQVNVYPNPASDLFTIALNENIVVDAKIIILNMVGQAVYSILPNQAKTTISAESLGLKAGIYLVQIKYKDQHKVVRLIVR